MQPVACWHHRGGERLDRHLRRNRIDLYGPYEVTRTGQNRRGRFWKRMRLNMEDRVRIVVKGKIVATAVIKSQPYTLPVNEASPPWQSAVDLGSIEPVNPPEPANCFGHCQGSHRLDGRGPCS